MKDKLQSAVIREVAAGCEALGLRTGPVHAELRLDNDEPWLIEVAARSIGGLCSRTLRFGTGISLEQLILNHALGREIADTDREAVASGVMMIPIPAKGTLRRVSGLGRARAVEGIREIEITQHVGAELVPLPEGHRYLGFIFAQAAAPDRVEAMLREAHSLLAFDVS